MAVDLKKQLDRVAAKAGLLVDRCNSLQRQRDEALQQVSDLEKQLAEAQAEIRRLNVDNEYLRVATALTPDRKEIERVRLLISGLVRDIDRCILDLKE